MHPRISASRLWLSFLIGPILLLLTASCRGNAGESDERRSVVLAVGGKTAVAYLPLTIAVEKGFFAAQGIEVDVQDLQGGARALQALVAGSADVVIGYYDHTIQMQAKNKELTAITLIGRYPAFVLAARSDLAGRINRIGDLKGMKVGVTTPGSSSQFMVDYLLSKEGLRPSDVSIIGIGVGQTAVAAVEQKQVDTLVNMDPTITFLQERGTIKILADTRSQEDTEEIYGGEYPGAVVYTTRDFIERNSDTASRLVKAIVEALDWIVKKEPAEIAEALPRSYFAGDKDLYIKALSNSRKMYSPDGRFPESAPAKVLKVLSLFDRQVAGARIDLEKTYTNRFVDEALSLRNR